VPVGAGIRVGAEDVDEQVGETARDAEEAGRARPGRRDPGLDQVPGAVELVPHLEVAPALAAFELPVAVQIAIGLLGSGDQLSCLGREALQLG